VAVGAVIDLYRHIERWPQPYGGRLTYGQMILVRLGLRPDNEEAQPMHPDRMRRFVERAQVKEAERVKAHHGNGKVTA
jgi:hypothetical protein